MCCEWWDEDFILKLAIDESTDSKTGGLRGSGGGGIARGKSTGWCAGARLVKRGGDAIFLTQNARFDFFVLFLPYRECKFGGVRVSSTTLSLMMTHFQP